MSKYTKKNRDGNLTEFEFIPSLDLPDNIPISTPLTFCFGGQSVLLVKKPNGWWDIPGGKMENNESYIDTIKRETIEEGGVEIDNIKLIGYILATNHKSEKSTFPFQTLLPVTVSFIKSVNWFFVPSKEIFSRDLVKRSEVKDFLNTRSDNGQLMSVYEYVIEFLDSQNLKYEFEYKTENLYLYDHLPITQACAFIMNGSGKFYAVRERGSRKYLLPGGGCHIYETGEECVRREALEELGIEIEDLVLLGMIIVRIFDGNHRILSESLQYRYFTKTKFNMDDLENRVDFEIEEVIEVSLDELEEKVEHLKNQNGPALIKSIKSLI